MLCLSHFIILVCLERNEALIANLNTSLAESQKTVGVLSAEIAKLKETLKAAETELSSLRSDKDNFENGILISQERENNFLAKQMELEDKVMVLNKEKKSLEEALAKSQADQAELYESTC